MCNNPDTLDQCWFKVGPASATMAQHIKPILVQRVVFVGQQKWDVYSRSVQGWASVVDMWPTFIRPWVNGFCLLCAGMCPIHVIVKRGQANNAGPASQMQARHWNSAEFNDQIMTGNSPQISLTLSVRGSTLDVRFWRRRQILTPMDLRFWRQILTSKVDPRTERVI